MDILVTHETTTEAFTALARGSEHAQNKAGEPAGEANRAHLTRIRDAATPRVHVHGHHHTRFAAPVAGVLNIGLNKETRDGSVLILDTTDWSWTTPVERFTYTHPDDDLTQPPTEHRHVDHQGLFEWDSVDLADPEVNLDTYDQPLNPGTVESIIEHRMILQRVTGRQHGFGLRQTLAARRIARTDTPEGTDTSTREQAAERLTVWIRDDDIDNLATHLLDPRPEFDIYRHLSPILEMWGTEEIRLWAAHAARN